MGKKALFLDRDGVINRRIVGDYVRKKEDFEILPGVLEAIALLSPKFDYIFIVTNQQGIGKGYFTVDDLAETHQYLLEKVQENGGRIDKIYFCPDLAKDNSPNRKPAPGMGLQAKADFPDIDFSQSIMLGDSVSDMEFGKALKLHTVFVTNGEELKPKAKELADEIFIDLLAYAKKQQ